MSERARPSLISLSPAGLSADLKAAGYRGPYTVDQKTRGLVQDRDGHTVVPIGPSPNAPDLRNKLADFLAATLTGLDVEQAALLDPADPPHIAAVEQQSRERNAVSDFSRRLGEGAVQKRQQAGE